MRHVRAVCLDLDDTLWDISPVLRRAEESFHSWLAMHYPAVTALETVESLRARRVAVGAAFPEYSHDLLALRRELYRQVGEEAGCDPSMADAACREFQRLRNKVTLYQDVRPALEALRLNRVVVALSNGTADLAAIGLADCFDARFSAAELGVSKPDVAVFHGVCARIGLQPGQVLHVGDDPENDVIGPRRAGMPSVWLNRRGVHWPHEAEPPEHAISDLHELVKLLQ